VRRRLADGGAIRGPGGIDDNRRAGVGHRSLTCSFRIDHDGFGLYLRHASSPAFRHHRDDAAEHPP
jgi:hypothetical protein